MTVIAENQQASVVPPVPVVPPALVVPPVPAALPTLAIPLAQGLAAQQPQILPNQLSAEEKHLRDFRKYDPQTFNWSLEDPTKAELWLSSMETIFNYMRCPEEHRVQCAAFLLRDRGII